MSSAVRRPGRANTIAFNLDNGVGVVGSTTTGNSILSNLIFGNGLLGIDLGDDGVTLNHATATTGPNNFQNFPVISSVVSSGASPIVGGTLEQRGEHELPRPVLLECRRGGLGLRPRRNAARLGDCDHRRQRQRDVQRHGLGFPLARQPGQRDGDEPDHGRHVRVLPGLCLPAHHAVQRGRLHRGRDRRHGDHHRHPQQRQLDLGCQLCHQRRHGGARRQLHDHFGNVGLQPPARRARASPFRSSTTPRSPAP